MRLASKISAVALAVAAAASVSAQAQSIDVRVIGTITPAACTPTIGGGGVVDYGNIPASSLNVTSFNKLAEREVPFSITCDAPARVAVRAVDNRAGSLVPGIAPFILPGASDSLHGFGLGTVSGDNVGGYVMRMKPGTFTVDGVPGFVILSGGNGTDGTWVSTVSGRMSKDPNYLTSWAATPSPAPAAFTNLAGTFSVEAALNKGEDLPLTDDVPLDGLATIELVYL